ncbi:MAG: hypothetical protein JW863_09925 [Chitinispirillaceae bacterium]|nr:hypothetical protein [Chitinispirillaceae bacterium]
MKNRRIICLVVAVFSVAPTTGCLRHLTQDRSKVLLEGVDIDQTLLVARDHLSERNGRWGSSLGIWVIRDQPITPAQAQVISRMYFQYIGSLKKEFDIWHFTWAIANLFRLGNNDVKDALQAAYTDAGVRALRQGGLAHRMTNGAKMYLGDAHSGGRAFAKKHVVVPGNRRYLQSYDEYAGKKSKEKQQ